MCKTCQSTLYTPCNHLVDGPLRPSLFCLFGHLCSEAGHVDRVLSVSEDKENCPWCADPRLGAEGGELHSPASKNNMPSGARKSAMQAIILENLEAELRGVDITLEKYTCPLELQIEMHFRVALLRSSSLRMPADRFCVVLQERRAQEDMHVLT